MSESQTNSLENIKKNSENINSLMHYKILHTTVNINDNNKFSRLVDLQKYPEYMQNELYEFLEQKRQEILVKNPNYFVEQQLEEMMLYMKNNDKKIDNLQNILTTTTKKQDLQSNIDIDESSISYIFDDKMLNDILYYVCIVLIYIIICMVTMKKK